jgi:hypothetical protein
MVTALPVTFAEREEIILTWDTDGHVDGKQQVESGEEEVDICMRQFVPIVK